jgi:hypothetical protein
MHEDEPKTIKIGNAPKKAAPKKAAPKKAAAAKKATPKRMKAQPANVDPGPPVKIAVSATEFATVSTIDWGYAYYYGEWKLGSKGPTCQGMILGKFVAMRMGCNMAMSVAYKDGNPLNCTRENVFTTPYVWAKGTVRRKVVTDENKEGEWAESPGWTYGNVGICQGVNRNGNDWTMIHLPTGMTVGASWSNLKKAQAGVEAIHAAANLADLDRYAKFKEVDQKRWRGVIMKYKEA